LINGLLVGAIKMPAFIVTLATMLMYRSIAQTIMNSNDWTIYQLDAGLSQWMPLWTIGNASIPGTKIPLLVLILAITVIIMTYLTTSTKFGKKVYALGSNERAAQLSGVNISATRVLVYVIAGVLIGLASFLYVANMGSVDPATSGKNYELYAIAGVVIGGLSMTGGRGKILGIVFGSMSFTIIDKIINALGLNPLINDTIKGGILLLAIAVQMLPMITRNWKHKTTKEVHQNEKV
ncbi:MAG: ABC transporter permease, partial [Ruthenibacterium sp.]